MSRCRTTILGLLATLLYTSVHAEYSGNLFLNGQYQNGVKSHPETHFSVNPVGNIFLEHAIISRQASPFTGPTYLPPKEYIKCASGQQCVRQGQCQNGYYSQQVPKIQNCEAETDICCTYRAPPTTTTPKPYNTCRPDSDCVAARDCRNGEIVATDYVRKQVSDQCYAPEVCCRMPSTTLTNDGYIFNLPTKKFSLPTTPRPLPTKPVYRGEEELSQPAYRPQPTQQPQPQPAYRPQPTQPAYRPQPTQPAYRPQPTQPPKPAYRPQPTQPANEYLPPQPTRASQTPGYRQPQPQTPAPFRPQPVPQTPAPYRPQPAPQTPAPYRPQPAPQTPTPYRPQPAPQTPTPYRPQPAPQTPAPYRPPQPPRQQPAQPTYRPQPQPRPTPNYLPPNSINEIIPGDRTAQSSNVKPVYRGEDQLSPQIFPSRQPGTFDKPAKHFAKCASALLCTDVNYCNAIGTISDSPVNLSPMEAAFRVPLTDCMIPETGAEGKCCRDSNYVDPWPVNLAGVCATRNKNTSPKGIKDIDANFAEIPWQAMILKESTKSLLCGGAIIGDEFVITTATCVNGVPVNDVRVKAGEWELGSTTEPLPFQLVGVKSITTHPEFNPSTGANDMAIIRLEKRLEFATHIQPICISDEDPSPSEQCVTTGWGKQALSIHEEGAIMHRTTTSVLGRSDCGADSTSVCSATKFDSCEFDLGSALACGSGSSVRLKGVFSAENGCGEGQAVRFSKPDVKWINTAFAKKNKPLLQKRF